MADDGRERAGDYEWTLKETLTMGFKTRYWKWFACETGELVTRSDDNLIWSAQPVCPQCHIRTEWDEFQTGQDLIGNDEYGGCFRCDTCQIHTKVVEVDRRDYIEDEMGFE